MSWMRCFWFVFIVASAGCVELDVKLREPMAPLAAPAPAPPRPVTAEQVTAANARQMAQALWDECDREEEPRGLSPR